MNRQPVRGEQVHGRGGGPIIGSADTCIDTWTEGQRPRAIRRRLRRADLTAVADVRKDLRHLLLHWGETGRSDIAELLISELVTNALVHTDRGAVVTATVTDRLRVEVRDFVSRRPRSRRPTTEGTSGRGLMLVRSLADAWGIRMHGVGKCVWFELGGTGT
ncbi:ATP-binding protein [Streptomyces sp. NPDC047117]|uniref:ATP-binding protein n=1 Tax=unclassified Streptomyces TaxID=2593676 RepID=UPI0033CD4271